MFPKLTTGFMENTFVYVDTTYNSRYKCFPKEQDEK